MAGNGRYTTLLLFEAFEKALMQFMREDEQVLSWPRAKASVAHSLASQLQRSLRSVLGLSEDNASPGFFSLPGDVKVDILIKGCDILVHDRKGKHLLGIVLGYDYFSRQQQEHLHQLKGQGFKLVLGVSFLMQKEYVLLYSPKQESLEYYHFNKQDGTTHHLMQRDVESETDDGQLSLGIKERKKRKNPAPTQDQ